MVSAMIDISERANMVLNIIKARYGFSDKSQAIERMAQEYEEQILEPQFKPAFVKEVKKAQKGKFLKLKSVDELFA